MQCLQNCVADHLSSETKNWNLMKWRRKETVLTHKVSEQARH